VTDVDLEDEHGDPEVRRVKFVLFASVFSAVTLVIVLMLVFGQPDGQRRLTHWPNGYKKTETWFDAREGGVSLQQGPHRAWYEDGQLAEEGEYAFGERAGIWKFWDENGNFDTERSGFYRDDVRVSD